MKKIYTVFFLSVIATISFGQKDCDFNGNYILHGKRHVSHQLVDVATTSFFSFSTHNKIFFSYQKIDSNFYIEMHFSINKQCKLEIDTGSRLIISLKNGTSITLFAAYKANSTIIIQGNVTNGGTTIVAIVSQYKVTRKQLELIREHKFKKIKVHTKRENFEVNARRRGWMKKNAKAITCILNYNEETEIKK